MRAIDWLLLAICAALLIVGPAMALQEWSRYEQQLGVGEVTGETPPLEPAFRAAWRAGLLAMVIVGGIAGTVIAVRAARQPKVRGVSTRLLWLLLSGMTLLDLTFLADGRWFMDAPYAIRGSTIVWVYPIAALLMGGAVLRLAELQEVFGDERSVA